MPVNINTNLNNLKMSWNKKTIGLNKLFMDFIMIIYFIKHLYQINWQQIIGETVKICFQIILHKYLGGKI